MTRFENFSDSKEASTKKSIPKYGFQTLFPSNLVKLFVRFCIEDVLGGYVYLDNGIALQVYDFLLFIKIYLHAHIL
ncbi:hypothetical protein BP422_19645 [Brevibacillus formosus]|uniref:Uncharacterized protein n=1 Tax=Brevibacillus formosus TaxID=54913 RepID=A0A220MLB7_9BACL|nr:hypothetical protein BP422_19645 [Brevibacillus formosus]